MLIIIVMDGMQINSWKDFMSFPLGLFYKF